MLPKIILLVFFLLLKITVINARVPPLRVYLTNVTVKGRLDHFWTSTGFTVPEGQKPKEFYSSSPVRTNLAMIGSLPMGSVSQVRIHWLLDLIQMQDPDSNPLNLDFAHLDHLLDLLYQNDLKPGFEIMGNPGGYFTDFEDPVQLILWRKVITKLADHLIARYGSKELESWNFETWNEPDHKDFGSINITLKGFLNYVDASYRGLKDTGLKLRFGGPGGSCRHPHFIKYCHGLLQHVQNGSNYFTGKSCNQTLDFLSFHKKGQEEIGSIIKNTEETISKLYKKFPVTRTLPIFNDEGDPMKSWWQNRTWRGDTNYPALVASNIIRSQENLIQESKLNFKLLSNDNAFLNWDGGQFDQRTLLSKFDCGENGFSLVQKPIYNLMAMLNLQGQYQIAINSSKLNLEVLGSTTLIKDHTAILINNNDKKEYFLPIKVFFNDSFGNGNDGGLKSKLLIHKINEDGTNPREAWINKGSPKCPDSDDLKLIWKAGQLKLEMFAMNRYTFFEQFEMKMFQVSLNIPKPSVTLLQICHSNFIEEIPQPNKIKFFQTSVNNLIITWRFASSLACMVGFSIEHSDSPFGKYRILNQNEETIMNHFTALDVSTGWFRVQAIDAWGRKGPYSVPQKPM